MEVNDDRWWRDDNLPFDTLFSTTKPACKLDKDRLISAIAFRQHSVDRTNTIGASTQQQTGSSSPLKRIGSDRLGMDITTSLNLVALFV